MLLFNFAPFVNKQTTKKLSVVELIVKQAGHCQHFVWRDSPLAPPIDHKVGLEIKECACLTIAD